MKKTLGILGIALLALVIVISIVAGFYIGPIVKIGMEQIGPKITRVSVKVNSVDVALLFGSAKIKGLIVGNPAGYTTPEAISVGTIAVSLDPFSVTSKKIVVHAVRVRSPEITFDGGLTSNNLSRILDNVNASAKNDGGLGTSNNKPAPKIEVDDFLITGAKVRVHLSGLGSKELSLPLPDIHLTDLGKRNDGLTPVELTRAILKAVIKDTLHVVISSVGNLKHGLQRLGKNALSEIGEGGNTVTSGLGGLFGK